MYEMNEVSKLYLIVTLSIATCYGFNPYTPKKRSLINNPHSQPIWNRHTALSGGQILPVPDNFFTIAGAALGLALTLSRSINRVALENRAWESRLEDARIAKLEEDEEKGGSSVYDRATYTELDLRRRDAAGEKSAYGPEAMTERILRRDSRRTITRDRERDEPIDKDENSSRSSSRTTSMSDEEIYKFETENGCTYDPYYDEPYNKEELPVGIPFFEDKVYGDRRYENGEVFYRDEENKGLYWRQGGKPRLRRIWRF